MNTGVSCYSLLQGIFLTQGSNPSLPHCKQTLYHLSYQGSPRVLLTYHFYNINKELNFSHFICWLTGSVYPLAHWLWKGGWWLWRVEIIAENEGKCRLCICVLSGLWKCYNAVSQWTRNSLKALELSVWFLVLFISYECYPCSRNTRYKVPLLAVNKKSYLQLEVHAHISHWKVQPCGWMRNDTMHSE